MLPNYPTPWPLIARLVLSVFFRRKLSFHKEAQEAVRRISPPVKVLGKENVPSNGPCLLTTNHYYRPGFGAWWIALGIVAALPKECHWMMASAWTYPNQPLGKQKEAITHWAFIRVARVMGLTSMPPMPPRPQDTVARAEAVRQVLSYVRQHPDPMVGIAPEGSDSPGGVLAMPPSGVGRFIYHMAKMGLRIVPVGAYEDSGYFCLNFGQDYELVAPANLSPDERDCYVSQVVMSGIARLIPEQLRGTFGQSSPVRS